MKTLLLDLTFWDLCLDANGNIAVATDPYAIAQSVANACRTFLGECWYNTAIGVPYLQQVLGKFPALAVVKNMLSQAAATVPGCNNPVVILTSFNGRVLSGQVQFTDANGNQQVATFGPPTNPPQLPLQDNAGNIMSDNAGNVMFGSIS